MSDKVKIESPVHRTAFCRLFIGVIVSDVVGACQVNFLKSRK